MNKRKLTCNRLDHGEIKKMEDYICTCTQCNGTGAEFPECKTCGG